MKTNELKKGMVVQLRNGWFGVMADNMKGNTRMVKVYGDYTEIGSVYSHDIVKYLPDATEKELDLLRLNPLFVVPFTVVDIEHTKPQLNTKRQLELMGW